MIASSKRTAPYSWPHDDTASLLRFYGRPWEDGALLTHVAPPFRMTYEGAAVHGLLVHVKVAPALSEALQTIWDSFSHDQDELDATGFTKYSGAYNYRNVRGATSLSCHAFGAALDFDAEHNPLGGLHGRLAQPPAKPIIAAFKAVGAFWGGDFVHRKDEMHFQFATEG